jgi:hypothetical protein
MRSKRIENLLLQKQLGDRLAWTIKQHKARFVLIASPRVGDGKSTLLCMIRPYLEVRYPKGYFFLSLRDLLSVEPEEIPEGIVVLVDGPAIMEGVESIIIPYCWQDVIKDAVLVVRGRNTTTDELQECCSRLESMEIRCIGAIYNEQQDPSWRARKEAMSTKIERILSWGKQPALEAPIPVVIPTPNRSIVASEMAAQPDKSDEFEIEVCAESEGVDPVVKVELEPALVPSSEPAPPLRCLALVKSESI